MEEEQDMQQLQMRANPLVLKDCTFSEMCDVAAELDWSGRKVHLLICFFLFEQGYVMGKDVRGTAAEAVQHP